MRSDRSTVLRGLGDPLLLAAGLVLAVLGIGMIWSAGQVDLPSAVAQRGITLSLGPIDDSDRTWVNGNKVGEMTQEYDVDRVYDVPAEYLKGGRNVIAVRVEDTGGGGGFHGSAIHLQGKW